VRVVAVPARIDILPDHRENLWMNLAGTDALHSGFILPLRSADLNEHDNAENQECQAKDKSEHFHSVEITEKRFVFQLQFAGIIRTGSFQQEESQHHNALRDSTLRTQSRFSRQVAWPVCGKA
jgi:hypothetical protein